MESSKPGEVAGYPSKDDEATGWTRQTSDESRDSAMYLVSRGSRSLASREEVEDVDEAKARKDSQERIDSSPIVCHAEDAPDFAEVCSAHLDLPGVDGHGCGVQKVDEASPSDSLLTPESPSKEWDVAHAGRKKQSLIEKSTMIVPAVTRAALGVIGGTIAGVGYGAGKLGEVVGGRKAVDSVAFRAGFTSFMWTNGIFPTVHYEPLGASEAYISELYQMQKAPTHDDISLTPIIVSNHVSYLDGVVLASVFGAPKIVAKAGARSTPVIGRLMEEMEVVFVERNSSDSRHATLDAIKDHCSAWRPKQRPLLIFPEGTTTNGESLAPFKRGAFAGGVPVRPVIIVYTGQFDPANPTFKETEHGDGVEKISDGEWGAQFMGHFIHSIHIRVLAPYTPTEAEVADPALYATNCQEFMAKALARVRAEIDQSSWKAAAGRTEGGTSYRVGDISRIAFRRTRASLTNLTDGMGSCLGSRPRLTM